MSEAAKALRIERLYLPTYSPNLNLIERFWKFLKRKVARNRYQATFAVCERPPPSDSARPPVSRRSRIARPSYHAPENGAGYAGGGRRGGSRDGQAGRRQATKPAPNRRLVQISAEGLKQAAQTLAAVAPDVLMIATKIAKAIVGFVA